MSETHILVPICYPLKGSSVRTLERAIEIADVRDDAVLSIFHVNTIHESKQVSQEDLARDVEREIGPLANATYDVRDAFLVEEAILYEAIQQKADSVVIGKDTRVRWRRILSHRLGIDADIEKFLRHNFSGNLVVV